MTFVSRPDAQGPGRFDGPTPRQRAIVEAVDKALDGGELSVDVGRVRSDPRALLRRLGRERLLAPHWPSRYGGRDSSLAEAAAVAEHLGRIGIPDVLHLVSVQAVGSLVLLAGSEEQRRRFLPSIAAGELFAAVLFSEQGAGTDLAGISTLACERRRGVYSLEGDKAWSLHVPWCQVALCSAVTDVHRARQGISLFLIPLDDPHVELHQLPGISPEPLWQVSLRGVEVPRACMVGREHGGWPLMLRSISLERAGFDYLSRALRWHEAACESLAELPPPAWARATIEHRQLGERIWAARALAYAAVAGADGLEMDEAASAAAKVACSEVAQAVAWWWAGLDGVRARHNVLLDAIAEAPGLSVSGGPTEALLDLVASRLMDEDVAWSLA